MIPTRHTAKGLGYVPSSCEHAKGWRRGKPGDMHRCPTCGTERTESYEPLRFPLPTEDCTEQAPR
ncbi:DUF6255 family natural product biosynthesis protein [Streptomyces sp. NPDC057654]|uniref:DUF6255 family natural product biosynthesis protein n=1 Tax=Streptomyces sp. NPDC057654 TaxID=3346196 RepID=UPI003676335A